MENETQHRARILAERAHEEETRNDFKKALNPRNRVPDLASLAKASSAAAAAAEEADVRAAKEALDRLTVRWPNSGVLSRAVKDVQDTVAILQINGEDGAAKLAGSRKRVIAADLRRVDEILAGYEKAMKAKIEDSFDKAIRKVRAASSAGARLQK